MTHPHPNRRRSILVDPPTVSGFAATSWGERSRARIKTGDTLGAFAMLDYRAPAGFGPPRHVHHEDDEIFLIVSGTIVLWMPDCHRTAGPGDVVLLPKAVPHTWRAYGEDGVHFHIIVAPGHFETFFEQIAARHLSVADTAELAHVAEATGMTILGPSLDDDEVTEIRRGRSQP